MPLGEPARYVSCGDTTMLADLVTRGPGQDLANDARVRLFEPLDIHGWA